MSHNQGCQLGPYGDPSIDYGNYQVNPDMNPNDISLKRISEETEETDKDGRRAGRRKIKIEYIQDKSRRHITFSKRKAGIMKKAYELSTLTGTQVLLLVVSETGLVYTFTTPKLQPLVTKTEGKNLIQSCLNTPDELQKEGSAAPEAEPEEGGFSSGDTAAPTLPNGNREPEPIKRLLDHAQDEMHKHEAKKFSPDQPQLSYGGAGMQPPYPNPPSNYQPLNSGAYPSSNQGSMPPAPQYQHHPQNPYMGPPHHPQPPHPQPHQQLAHHHQPSYNPQAFSQQQLPQQQHHPGSAPSVYTDFHNPMPQYGHHGPPPPAIQYSHNQGGFYSHPGPPPSQQ